MDYAIEARKLTKIYGDKAANREIDLTVRRGIAFGLLGQNGAGKSTFVKMLVGLTQPTSGSALLLGKPIGDVASRSRIGFLPELFKYQDWLSGRELLALHASLAGLPRASRAARIEAVLGIVKLSAAGDSKIRTYSKGMQQRLGIACALVADPDILFLDEPTSALDPVGRIEVREIIADLKGRGKTVFLNSHLLGEVETVCDEVAIMKAGSIVTRGRLSDLLGGEIEIAIQASGLGDAALNSLFEKAALVSRNSSHLTLTVKDEESIAWIAKRIIDSGASLYELSRSHRTLEELFLDAIKGAE